MIVQIDDDFDLYKIAVSGQCFRVQQNGSTFGFVTGRHFLNIKHIGNNRYVASCSPEEWSIIWTKYFDLRRNYRLLYQQKRNKHHVVNMAMNYGRGLRVLRQDPWEMLVTFIISQRKKIPSIEKCVNTLAFKYGDKLSDGIFSFPSPQSIANLTESDLKECNLGYRAVYVLDAARKVSDGRINLITLENENNDYLLCTLKSIYGVGEKVANCVALFGYGRVDCVPIDVWVKRFIDVDCGGISPFFLFSDEAGIIQQYVFYYKKHHSN